MLNLADVVSDADVMFDELGYHKFMSSCGHLHYFVNYQTGLKIIFFDEHQHLKMENNRQVQGVPIRVDKNVLNAINKKAEELGW